MWTASLIVYTIPSACRSYETATFTCVGGLSTLEDAMDQPLMELSNDFSTMSSRVSRHETEETY
jgi:hypothetical protein